MRGSCADDPSIVGSLLGEIHKKRNRQPGCPQVGAYLRIVDLSKVVHRLQLDKNPIIDHEIETMSTHQLAIVFDLDLDLGRKGETTFAQFDRECALIYRLNESRAKHAVNHNNGVDDCAREPVALLSGILPPISIHPHIPIHAMASASGGRS
jgi:hypothetical protein